MYKDISNWWQNAGILFAVSGCALYLLLSQSVEAQTETSTLSAQSGDQVTVWLQEADTYMEQDELPAAYDLYLRVLGLDPTNTYARPRIFEILHHYKSDMATLRGQPDAPSLQLSQQRYRSSIRDLLQLLTTRLKHAIERYGELVKTLQTGNDAAQELPLVLTTIIQILKDLTTLYEEYPQAEKDVANTRIIVERLRATIAKYEHDLAGYQQQSAGDARTD